MSAGILSFSDYIGGPDEITAEQIFPSDQKSYRYDFGTDITGWTFSADYQTLVVDVVSFNRYTGKPNFSNSKVIGSFDKVDLTGNNAPVVANASDGTLDLRIPAGMYNGPIVPDARVNVPITVVALTWTTDDTYPFVQTHRWAFVQAWEPGVDVGSPTQDAGYTALSIGA